jgi:macrolide transport system ATP-binding/permease protein
MLNLNLADNAKVAVIGDNGTGKTTLLRLIAGELTPENGSVRTVGKIGYLKQTHDDLPKESGGERTKMKLSELFGAQPDILLLDEPTNNLDIAAKDWLRDRLQRFSGLVLFASHDRSFIDDTADKVAQIKDTKIKLHNGNYSDFLARTEQIKNEQNFAYKKANQEKRKLLKQISIAKNRANKTTHQRYDKMRDEDRMSFISSKSGAQNKAGKIVKSSQSKIERLSNVEKPAERKTYSARVSANFSHNRQLLKIENLSKSFENKCLFKNLNFEIKTGERIRIIGGNGAGKTTLLKIIMDEIKADSGAVKFASNLKLGYISQDVCNLNLDESFIDQINIINKSDIFKAASTMDFEPQDMSTPVRDLSRGQITKLAILKIILTPVNLLILDELTNHLDIRARENIERALTGYRGSILVATHDETLADVLDINKDIVLPNFA